MPEKSSTPPPKPPVGTPPEGGRWSWDGTQWVRLPESEASPAATTPASKE